MKTSKKQLERGYDALSNAIAAFRSAKRPTKDSPYGDDIAALVDLVRRRGSDLLSLMANASVRCGADLLQMCDSLTDQSADILIAHSGDA